MRFEDALSAMREGKKVKRKDFTCYFFMDSSRIFVTYSYNTNKKSTELKEYFWLCDILAEDWEIVENA